MIYHKPAYRKQKYQCNESDQHIHNKIPNHTVFTKADLDSEGNANDKTGDNENHKRNDISQKISEVKKNVLIIIFANADR